MTESRKWKAVDKAILEAATRQHREGYHLGFNAGRKQGMKDAAEIIAADAPLVRTSIKQAVVRSKQKEILEAMEKLP